VNSDNGKEFVNKLMERLAREDCFEWRTISSYNSRGQGAVERANKEVELILKKVVDGDFENWPMHLDDVAFAMNTRISTRTLSQPFLLMFGRMPQGQQKFRKSKDLKVEEKDLIWKEKMKRSRKRN
jgi:transposase InsO family protein